MALSAVLSILKRIQWKLRWVRRTKRYRSPRCWRPTIIYSRIARTLAPTTVWHQWNASFGNQPARQPASIGGLLLTCQPVEHHSRRFRTGAILARTFAG